MRLQAPALSLARVGCLSAVRARNVLSWLKSQNILMCRLGMSPQILIRVYYFIAIDRPERQALSEPQVVSNSLMLFWGLFLTKWERM